MKKMASLLLVAGLALSACGSPPPQISGNGRVSIGVAAGDATSSVTATRTYNAEKGEESWAVSGASPVSFVFMARPGSDAAYITGYRILRYDYNGKVSTEVRTYDGLDIYVPSGYTCPERQSSLPAYQSCLQFNTDGSLKQDTIPANGLPTAPLDINFAGALVPEIKRTLSDAYSSVDLEFIGHSADGQPISIITRGVTSRGYKAGN